MLKEERKKKKERQEENIKTIRRNEVSNYRNILSPAAISISKRQKISRFEYFSNIDLVQNCEPLVLPIQVLNFVT